MKVIKNIIITTRQEYENDLEQASKRGETDRTNGLRQENNKLRSKVTELEKTLEYFASKKKEYDLLLTEKLKLETDQQLVKTMANEVERVLEEIDSIKDEEYERGKSDGYSEGLVKIYELMEEDRAGLIEVVKTAVSLKGLNEEQIKVQNKPPIDLGGLFLYLNYFLLLILKSWFTLAYAVLRAPATAIIRMALSGASAIAMDDANVVAINREPVAK